MWNSFPFRKRSYVFQGRLLIEYFAGIVNAGNEKVDARKSAIGGKGREEEGSAGKKGAQEGKGAAHGVRGGGLQYQNMGGLEASSHRLF